MNPAPEPDEDDPLERARKRALRDRDYARDYAQLAGVLADEAYRPALDERAASRPVTDISLGGLP